jgi:hypothetical protein
MGWPGYEGADRTAPDHRSAPDPAPAASARRPRPVAPRLQIALHLSLTLNEQHRSVPVYAAPVMPAATAPTERNVSTSGRLASATHLTRVETAYRTSAGARIGSPLSVGYDGSGFPQIALSSGGRPRLTRLGKRPATLGAGAAARQASSGPPADRNLAVAAHRDGAGRIVAPGTTGPLYLAEGQSEGTTTPASFGFHPARRSDGPASHAGVTPPWPLRQEAGATRTAYISRGLSGRGHVLVTRSGNRPTVVRAGAAATIAPLYLAERQSGPTAAPASFSSAWAPPPLDFRSAAPPPVPPPAEARPAAATAPSAAPVDLEAVSRDVISRIEKRLRVERERRGRS